MCRRSVSSWVSPGPRVPMGLFPPEAVCRTRWPHMPVSRGSRYWYWASSTCSRPSRVRARWAKMSRMRAARSSTWTPNSSDNTRCWEGERALSKMTRSAPAFRTSSFTSAVLPSPIKVRASGASRFCSAMPTQTPPAVSSRASSSSMDASVAHSSRGRLWALRPTSTARSRLSSVYCVIKPPRVRSASGPPRSLRYTCGGNPFRDSRPRRSPHPENGPDQDPASRLSYRPAPARPVQNKGPSPRPPPR